MGHIYSGTQNLAPENCSQYLCICHLSLGERDTFSESQNPKFKLHLGHTLALETWPQRRLISLSVYLSQRSQISIQWAISLTSMYCTCGISTHNTAEISYSRFFLHFLAAWNNDCSRFRGRIEKKKWLFIDKPKPNLYSWDTFLEREGVPCIEVLLVFAFQYFTKWNLGLLIKFWLWFPLGKKSSTNIAHKLSVERVRAKAEMNSLLVHQHRTIYLL